MHNLFKMLKKNNIFRHFLPLVGDTVGQARRAHLESLFIFWLQFVEKRGVVV